MSQDRELETYLQGKADVSQLYADAPQVELPDHLDAAILAEAHRAVKSRPAVKSRRRWPIPLGMVASLFAVVIIGLQLPYMLQEARQPQLQKEERIAVAAIEKSISESASPAPAERRESPAAAKPKAELARSEPAPMAAAMGVLAKPNAPVVAVPQEPLPAGNKPLGAASVAAPAPATAPMPAPAIASKRADMRERADVDDGVASKEKEASGAAAGDVSDSLEQRAPAAAQMTAPQPARQDRSAIQPLTEETGEASTRPEDWLIRIRRLKEQGKLDEAKKELAAFKKRYPDYRVPEALEVR